MRHIHLDLVGGLAGDMFLAAAIDAGIVSVEEVEQELGKVGLGPVKVHVERVIRGAIEGAHVRFSGWDEKHDSDHRHLTTIRRMLSESGLDEEVRRRAAEMFEVLGEAEAAVHGVELERVHFHEVGAVDSILDFVAAALVIERARATWSLSEIPVGKGSIETAHGTIPLPAPATARVLEGLDVRYQDVSTEFVTPTGATILKTLSEMPGTHRGRMVKSGFGCGTRQVEGISNVVRFVVLEQTTSLASRPGSVGGAALEEVVQLSCEIDDENPEIGAYVAGELLARGALDVVREPVQMKKGRLGTRLSVLCTPELEAQLVGFVFAETSSLGVRRQLVQRWTLQRSTSTVETKYGELPVKLAYWDGELLKASPEFEACAMRARELGVSLREVYAAVQEALNR